jgi:hypothetical protein
MISSKSIDKLVELAIKLSDKGGIALVAIACCGYLLLQLGEVQKTIVKLEKKDSKFEEKYDNLDEKVGEVKEGLVDWWDFWDNTVKPDMDDRKEKVDHDRTLAKEQIRELQRKH